MTAQKVEFGYSIAETVQIVDWDESGKVVALMYDEYSVFWYLVRRKTRDGAIKDGWWRTEALRSAQ